MSYQFDPISNSLEDFFAIFRRLCDSWKITVILEMLRKSDVNFISIEYLNLLYITTNIVNQHEQRAYISLISTNKLSLIFIKLPYE